MSNVIELIKTIEPTSSRVDGCPAFMLRVSPEMALDIIDRCCMYQRPVKTPAVKRLATAMSSGLFIDGASQLLFDADLHLLDGQHRMHAQVRSGRAVTYHVVTRLPAVARHIGELVTRRTVGDIMSMLDARDGIARPNSSVVGHSLRMIASVQTSEAATYHRARHADGHVIARLRPVWRDDAAAGVQMAHRVKSSGIPGFGTNLATIFAIGMYTHRLEMEAFAGGLATGVGLAKGSPILALRSRLMREAVTDRAKRASHPEAWAFIVRAWQAYLDGRTIARAVGLRGGDANQRATLPPMPDFPFGTVRTS